MTKVITYGTYDLLHYGHVKLLERAKALGDYLIVGVTSDDYDKTRGKINNQQSLMERVAAVRATGLADEIIIEEYDGQKIDDIQKYGVDIFTVGSDWVGKFDYLNTYCRVVYLPRTEGVSSTELRANERRLKLRMVGNLGYISKFAEELKYVNGVDVAADSEPFETVDAVYVASLPEHHYEDVKKALLCGKHVICQSPLAIRADDCRELLQLAHEKNLVLFDAIKTAYLTAYIRLLLLVKSGKIGDVVSVDATCTSLQERVWEDGVDLSNKQNTLCGWGPTALLPVFQILGTDCVSKQMVTRLIDEAKQFDGFTKIDFVFRNKVASIKVAKAAKSEGELIITGTKGCVWVPAPWWKTDYFELRYENPMDNKKFFYQLDGLGIRYEIVEFAKAIYEKRGNRFIHDDISIAIAGIMEDFYSGKYLTI